MLAPPELLLTLARHGGLRTATPARFMTAPGAAPTRDRNWAVLVRLTRWPTPSYRDLAHALRGISRKRIHQIVAAGVRWLRRELGNGHGELLVNCAALDSPVIRLLLVVPGEPLAALDLPTRVIHVLEKAGCRSVDDIRRLLQNRPEDLLRLPDIGLKTFEQIRRAVSEHAAA